MRVTAGRETGTENQVRRRRGRRALPWLAIGGGIALAEASVEAKVPVGPPLQVSSSNYYYPGYPHGPDVAMSSEGGFVIVWEASYHYSAIRGQLFDSTGGPIGGEFSASAPLDYARQGAVDMDSSGRFVIVWMGQDYYYGYAIMGRRFNALGSPVGPRFIASTTNDYGPRNPKVAVDDDRGFVVVWGQYDLEGSLSGQRFSPTGTKVGGEFEVAPPGSHGYSYFEDDDGIEIDARSSGEFMVAWRGFSYDNEREQILARAFDAEATALGPVFEVNTDVSANSRRHSPGIAADPDGNFVIVWRGDNAGEVGVWARRIDPSGTPLGLEFKVNASGIFPQFPKVSADPSGGFVVVWHDYDSYNDIRGRRFDASGTPLDPQFLIELPPYDYAYTDVATDADGDFIVSWRQDYPPGIRAQRFGDAPLPVCAPAPLAGCKEAATLKASSLRLIPGVSPAGRKLGWKWARGEATSSADLGAPLADDGTGYVFCVYDSSASAQPVLQAVAGGGGTCGLAACWKELGGAGPPLEYRHATGNADGLLRIRLTPGAAGKAKVQVQGQKQNLDLPDLPLGLPVTAQLQNAVGVCWTARFDTFVSKNDDQKFIARSGSLP